jgi:hypothetical protein
LTAAALFRSKEETEMKICSNCQEDAARFNPVGPIEVTIKDPELVGPIGVVEIFCSWMCFGDWLSNQIEQTPDDYLTSEMLDQGMLELDLKRQGQ